MSVNLRGTIRFGRLRMNCDAYQAYIGSRELNLSRTDWDLLEFFVRNPRQVLSRLQVYHRVWGGEPRRQKSNLLSYYVHRLRKELEKNGEPRLLHTVSGRGYVLRDPPAPEEGA